MKIGAVDPLLFCFIFDVKRSAAFVSRPSGDSRKPAGRCNLLFECHCRDKVVEVLAYD